MEIPTDGRAHKQRTTFRMGCGVATRIDAPPEKIWALLTDAAGFPKWNSTVSSIEGTIAPGQVVKLKIPESDRIFKLKVGEFDPNRRMVWSDGMMPMFAAARTYTLEPGGGGTVFRMVEIFRGLLLPMIAGQFPDFGPPFEKYAADLKRAAEG